MRGEKTQIFRTTELDGRQKQKHKDKDEVASVKDTKEYVNWKRCEFYGRNFVIKSKSEKSSNDVIQYKKCQSDIGNLNEKDVFFKFGILQ